MYLPPKNRSIQGCGSVGGGEVSPDKLRDRLKAHSLILEHARRAGIRADSGEMRHFARELFLLSRQCGAAGLGAQSHELFELAKAASEIERARGLDFRLYAIAARLLGWPLAGRLACTIDRFRA